MSVFSELLPQLNEISAKCVESFQKEAQIAFDWLKNFEKEYENARNQGKEKAPKGKLSKATLQSIIEDDDDPNKVPGKSSSNSSSTESSNAEQTRPKKRSKNEAEDILSPEVDKRQKRNASVKAQSFISKQVNVNLSAKLRREQSTEPSQAAEKEKVPRGRRRKDKENAEPNVPASIPAVQIKEEKLSLPPEPMDMDSLPVDAPVKQEPSPDEVAMPPPALPKLPKPKARAGGARHKSESSDEEAAGRRAATATKQPPSAPVAGARATRASSRALVALTDESRALVAPPEEPLPEARPKRTRAKKKASVSSSQSCEVDGGGGSGRASQESIATAASPAEKPRPKRTRRGKNNASPAEKPRPKRTRRGKNNEKQELPKPAEPIPAVSKEEPPSAPSSPILQKEKPKKKGKADHSTRHYEQSTVSYNSISSTDDLEQTKVIPKDLDKTKVIGKDVDKTKLIDNDLDKTKLINNDLDKKKLINNDLDKTRVISKDLDKTKVLSKDMDKTMLLTNGVYEHEPVTPNKIPCASEPGLRKAADATGVRDKPAAIMDCTVVIEKVKGQASNLPADDSLLTDDEDEEFHTPPARPGAHPQPSSAVKEKVQQFEELASRVTRTKTRALAKREEAGGDARDAQDAQAPERPAKAALSSDTLHKMNSLIFKGKPLSQVSLSASKPRAPAPAGGKSAPAASASKLGALGRQREAAEEDARKKKEALLEAKKEQQRRKREEKAAAVALARNNAERERRAQLELQARERLEKQAHADLGKLERMKEHERKKLELARKAADTEERRRAEEAARAQRLADEQRRALEQRRRQVEEQEAMKKEAARMAREIEKRQKEYLDKQRMKSRLEDKVSTPLKTPLKYHGHMSPVYMADGFQYLHSDSEDARPARPVPDWSTTKARKAQLDIQSLVSDLHVSRLFSVRVHSPDLTDIFPSIERARLKRTSSAVWRTPPALPLATLPE